MTVWGFQLLKIKVKKMKNKKIINRSKNKNYFYPAVSHPEYKGIYFSDQDIREKRIAFEKGAKTLKEALNLI